jgi:hypothetical protein
MQPFVEQGGRYPTGTLLSDERMFEQPAEVFDRRDRDGSGSDFGVFFGGDTHSGGCDSGHGDGDSGSCSGGDGGGGSDGC